MIAGLPCSEWVLAFRGTHNIGASTGVQRIEWPTGGAYAEQEHLVVWAMSVMGSETMAWLKANTNEG